MYTVLCAFQVLTVPFFELLIFHCPLKNHLLSWLLLLNQLKSQPFNFMIKMSRLQEYNFIERPKRYMYTQKIVYTTELFWPLRLLFATENSQL